jgi:hypothetical protein
LCGVSPMHLYAPNETEKFPRLKLATAALLVLTLGWTGCGSAQKNAPPAGGEGGEEETGGSTGTGGKVGGTGGSKATGGSGGTVGSGGSTGGPDAGDSPDTGGGSPDLGAADLGGGVSPDAGENIADAPPAANRPEAGQPCATGSNYNFTIKMFPAQSGKFTAFFSANPGPPPSNSVIGLSDGMKYLHDDFAAIVRFGTSGMLDVRNGTAYMSMTPIKYANIDYHFRLVIDIPGKKYSAYVTYDNMPEVPLGIDMAFRDSAGAVTMMNHWGVEAIAGHTTRVCNFAVVP